MKKEAGFQLSLLILFSEILCAVPILNALQSPIQEIAGQLPASSEKPSNDFPRFRPKMSTLRGLKPMPQCFTIIVLKQYCIEAEAESRRLRAQR